MTLFQLRSKEVVVTFEVEDRREAFKRFFEFVVEEDLIDHIGHIVQTQEDGEVYPMRTVPALYEIGEIGMDTAIEALSEIMDESEEDLPMFLEHLAQKDSWAVDGVNG